MRRRLLCAFLLSAWLLPAGDAPFLRRQLQEVPANPDGYKPLFGAGDADAAQLKSVARYGELTVAPGGTTAIVSYPAEEQIYFVEEGAATLLYAEETAPIRANDFLYLPAGVKHGIRNQSPAPVRVIVMGYRIPAGTDLRPTPGLMLANAGEVPRQVLGQHGPTTQFKLLMGLTSSNRDRLASAYVMDSLFLMDFAPGGTNIPHKHAAEEEIYLLLRGTGDMVAGLDANGREIRHPVTPGAAFCFKPGTQVGYYSHAREGDLPDLILAARSRL